MPGLTLDEPLLTQTIAARLSESLGEQKTVTLLSDEEGKAAIHEMLQLDVLGGGVRYHFEQVKAEDAAEKDRFPAVWPPSVPLLTATPGFPTFSPFPL